MCPSQTIVRHPQRGAAREDDSYSGVSHLMREETRLDRAGCRGAID